MPTSSVGWIVGRQWRLLTSFDLVNVGRVLLGRLDDVDPDFGNILNLAGRLGVCRRRLQHRVALAAAGRARNVYNLLVGQFVERRIGRRHQHLVVEEVLLLVLLARNLLALGFDLEQVVDGVVVLARRFRNRLFGVFFRAFVFGVVRFLIIDGLDDVDVLLLLGGGLRTARFVLVLVGGVAGAAEGDDVLDGGTVGRLGSLGAVVERLAALARGDLLRRQHELLAVFLEQVLEVGFFVAVVRRDWPTAREAFQRRLCLQQKLFLVGQVLRAGVLVAAWLNDAFDAATTFHAELLALLGQHRARRRNFVVVQPTQVLRAVYQLPFLHSDPEKNKYALAGDELKQK